MITVLYGTVGTVGTVGTFRYFQYFSVLLVLSVFLGTFRYFRYSTVLCSTVSTVDILYYCLFFWLRVSCIYRQPRILAIDSNFRCYRLVISSAYV